MEFIVLGLLAWVGKKAVDWWKVEQDIRKLERLREAIQRAITD